MKRIRLMAAVALVAMAASAAVLACGSTEVQTVVVERVVTQAPEEVVVVQTVEVPVEREVTRIETVEVEVPVERVVTQVETVEVEVPVERVVTQVETVEVERVVTQVETVVVEVTAEADAMMMSDEIPRNRQLILLWGGSGGVGAAGRYTDHDIWNIYNPGTSHQNGPGLIFEPLAYYSAFNDTNYPWLAESWEYNDDFTELTINLREGITWSDGTPFGAHDVAYTLQYLKDNSGLRRSSQVQRDVDSVEEVDANTVKISFLGPRPKFFYFMTYKFDIGLYIVPKHIFEGEDWLEFTHFDIPAGLPVTTGPWEVVQTSPEQKIINRRDSWWAVDQGLVEQLPEVLQIVYVPNPGETQMAQAVIANNADAALDLRPTTIREVLARNSAIVTHSGFNPPYGYVDWWPIGLLFNASEPPYNDKNVRWALSYYINREQLIEVAYDGAGTPSSLPIPSYAPLQRYFDAVEDKLSTTHNTTEYSPEKGDARMMTAGYTKNSDGYWEKDGDVVVCDILGFGIFNDFGPILARQLDNHGIKSSYSNPPNAWTRQSEGDASCGLRGHGGSVRDPYFTMNLYYGTDAEEAGEGHQANPYFWSNPRWNELTDLVSSAGIGDVAALEEYWTEAMDIWLEELPDVQVIEWYHRIPMNTTYWTNWPTHDNPYTNGAFWHLTFQLILNNLRATQ